MSSNNGAVAGLVGRSERIERVAHWLVAAADKGDRKEVEATIYRLRDALALQKTPACVWPICACDHPSNGCGPETE